MNQKQLKEYALNVLKGFNAEYVGYSDTNGQSMYFDVDGIKVRFSDHSVSNIDRIRNEVHFPINRIGSNSSNFDVEQGLLQLRYRLGDKTIKYGKRQMLMPSGKYLEGFGYTETKEYAEGGLIAPNGKPSNLTPEQYKLIRTKAFKDWFGDWENDPANASKVVDENGEPLVVYHGSKTNKDFYVFDNSKYGNQKRSYKNGYFFTSNYDVAKSFSKSTPKLFEVFLNIRKPKKINFKGANWEGYDDNDNQKVDYDLNTLVSVWSSPYLKKDGLIAENIYDVGDYWSGDNPIGNNYVAFEPNQIKLADGTNTTFDGNNPDIRYKKGGYVTYKDKYNTKYGYKKNQSHTLEEISKDTGVSMKGLQQIYNKGIGAYKTNPTSVRPNVKSKEQWAMARVYSAVMGGKTARIDSKELKMKYGGMTRRYAEGGKITQYEIEAMRNYINGKNPNPKLKESFEKVLRKFGVDLERSDLSDFNKGRYINPYNFSGYEYMRNINEEAGVSFLLTGEYHLVAKAIYEKDYAMWLFYNYLGRINISFQACKDWLNQAKEYFEYTMPIPIILNHTPKAKDGRSFALWLATSDKQKTESDLGKKLTFEYDGRWYYQEIGLVGNYDYNNDGWGTLYKESKTGLLIPEYTETSFHFNTLIHEFSHCLDFQTQLLANIEKFETKKDKKSTSEVQINTETMTDAEKALYAKQLLREGKEDSVVSLPITNHFDEFVDALIRVLRACAGGHIPLTQLYEQQALDVQTALEGVYGDLLIEQRIRKAQERKDVQKADEVRDDKRFTWQGNSMIFDIEEYVTQNAIQIGLKEKIQSKRKIEYTLTELIEFDNLVNQYFNVEYKKYMVKNPTKATQRIEDIKKIKQEINRLINNQYDNIKSGYQFGFQPKNELDFYLLQNCNVKDFRDYKSWKDCVKQSLDKFQ